MGLSEGLGGLGGGIGGLIGAATSGKGGKNHLRDALNVYKKLQLSNFDKRALSPPELELVAQFLPEVYQAIAPEEAQMVEDSAQGREGQVESLGQMQEVAREGEPLVDRLSREAAGREVMDAAAGSRRSALRNLSARGQLSSGQEIQANLAGSQQAGNLGAQLARDAAQQAALRRLSAVGQAGEMSGELRSGDVGVAKANADIANRFKEITANIMNQAGQYNAGAQERAQFANVENRQRVADTNEVNKYKTDLSNLERKNELEGRGTAERFKQAEGMAGVYGDLADWDDAKRAERIGNATALGQGIGGTVGGIGDLGGFGI